jgi:hypothetical protein
MYRASFLPGLLLFPFVMLIVLAAGMGLATMADASIWVPKRFGIGYTLDWNKPISWLLLGYTLVIVLSTLYGEFHPDAPGFSNLMQLLSSLSGSG